MLADTIKEIRKRNFLNQTAFANRIGVTQGTVSQWENGLTRPNSDQLRSISKTFNISIDDLLSGEKVQNAGAESPRTQEAKIVSGWMDKLPKEQREKILNMFCALYPEFVDEKGDDE